MLDEAGFPQARIFASGDLDEEVIWDLKAQGAAIDVWGVGTAYDYRVRTTRARLAYTSCPLKR